MPIIPTLAIAVLIMPIHPHPPVAHTLPWVLPEVVYLSELWVPPPNLPLPPRPPIAPPAPERPPEAPQRPTTPQPAPVAATPPPAPQAHAWGVEQWRPLVVAYWPPELVEWALRIMACESGGNPSARNPSSSAAGLFQFLRSTWDRGPAPALGLGSYDSGAVYDPTLNVMAAAWLYANWGGASQWSCKA